MRIAFVVPYMPNQIRTRPYNLICQMANRGHEITLYTLFSDQEEFESGQELKNYCEKIVAYPLPRYRSVWNSLKAIPTRSPLQAFFCWQPALLHELLIDVQKQNLPIDIVHIEHLRGIEYGLALKRKMDRGTPIVWDSVDCISYLFGQALRKKQGLLKHLMLRFELPRTEIYEGKLVDELRRILVTSDKDKAALLSLAAHKNIDHQPITVLPNGANLTYFSPDKQISRKPQTLVLSGKMSYHANIQMVRFFVDQVIPLIWEQKPNVQLWIVGKDPPQSIRALDKHPAIQVTGTVEDIRPYLREATIAVAPIMYGAGIQNKVLEAMACATPVVASSQATAALQTQAGKDLLIANTPEEFSSATLRLLNDAAYREQIGHTGRYYVEKNHDWFTIAGRLENIYQQEIDHLTKTGIKN